MKFLVVDDESDVELLYQQKLRKEIKSGLIKLEFAFSGEQALDILRNQNPLEIKYVLSDINMPGMSGLELLDHIKRDFPYIKVSMVSAYNDTENYQYAIQSGAKEFFVKPINFSALKEEIFKIIESEN
ncbi:MAG TPA: response regulator [Saprospiraceae bacterium]|nr:response regulator [Saprospiraceae bacterium]